MNDLGTLARSVDSIFQNPPARLAIVVASCDKYSDLWDVNFELFFKNWPDCPYPVYLIANHKRCENPKVTTLLAGEDLDWSTTISRAIANLHQSHLLFWMDDFFLVGRVDSIEIVRLFKQVVEKKLAFLRLRPYPAPPNWSVEGIGALSKGAAYRVSLPVTIWSVDTFRQIIKEGESAWEFEINGTERSRMLTGFYCTRHEVFDYLHGVERGVWMRPAAHELELLGYRLDYSRRRLMSRYGHVGLMYRRFKTRVLHLIPENQRSKVMQVIRHIYKVLGLRKARHS
jgi:hypothetical protein